MTGTHGYTAEELIAGVGARIAADAPGRVLFDVTTRPVAIEELPVTLTDVVDPRTLHRIILRISYSPAGGPARAERRELIAPRGPITPGIPEITALRRLRAELLTALDLP